jgi:hypothetical protein
MIVLLGSYCFGTVLGWVSAHVIHLGRPAWGEIKAAVGVLFGAALQAVLGKGIGIFVYGIGVAAGAVFYLVALLFRRVRRVHTTTEG